MPERKKLRIEQGCLCRGSGKVFIEVIVKGAEPTAEVQAASFIDSETAIPCDIAELVMPLSDEKKGPGLKDRCGDRTFVVTVPYLTVRQRIKVTCGDMRSQEAVQNEFKLDPVAAKWLSRLNYRRHPQQTRRIRNYDEDRLAGQLSFGVHYIAKAENRMVARISVSVPFTNAESEIRENINALELIAYAPDGSSISLETTLMSIMSRSKGDVGCPTYYELVYTLVFPQVYEEFIMAGRCGGRIMPGFFSVEKAYFHQAFHKGEPLMVNAQNDPAYHEWFLQKRVTPNELELQRAYNPSLTPQFSIIVPLFKTPLHYLEEMVTSVVEQSYSKWELILVNASPEDKALSERIRCYAQNDSRIKIVALEHNQGIMLNTNAGIAKATGDFVAFFDHDDVLEPDILFEYVRALENDPDLEVLYCDEDKLMAGGFYAQPFFKPDFSPDLLRNNNYICHMLTIRRLLLEELDTSSSDYDGAQDHNLILQASERTDKIGHVAKILYHWRMAETSTAANAGAKSYASQAGIRAVQEHLDRKGIEATATLSRRPFTYKLNYRAPQDEPKVSIIIPNKDGVEYLDRCLRSIAEKTTYANYEVIIVENNSTKQETFDYYEQLIDPRVKVEFWPKEFNFSKIINYGASKATGDFFLLLNNDVELITPTWIEELMGRAQRNDVGVVGARLFYPDRSIQHAGLWVVGGGWHGSVAGHLNRNLPEGEWGYFALSDAEQNLSAVTAACCMVSREVFQQVGGFTEEIPVAFNDVDFCLKVRSLGKLIIYTPEVELFHYESVTRGEEDDNPSKFARFIRECAYMHDRWADFYAAGDPYFNKNLSKEEPGISYYQLSRD